MRENRTQGSVRGRSGNWPFYLDGFKLNRELGIGLKMQKILDGIDKHVTQAVADYWLNRKAQKDKQKNRGVSDAGPRSAITYFLRCPPFVPFSQLLPPPPLPIL